MLHSLLLITISDCVTIGASILALLASLNATRVSANITREVNERSYKHDFYKKIIDRRLAAWEEGERFIASVSSVIQDGDDNKLLFAYCSTAKDFDAVFHKLGSILINQSLWMGKEYAITLTAFHTEQVVIRAAAVIQDDKPKISVIDDTLLQNAAKDHFDRCNVLVFKLIETLKNNLKELHEVEKFLEETEELHLNTPH